MPGFTMEQLSAEAANIEKNFNNESNGPVKLFVGQIPKQMQEEELRHILSEFGPIHEMSILRDRVTGASQGCAFVTYMDETSTYMAMEGLHDKRTLPGMVHPMQVKPAENKAEQRKLFIGMISRKAEEDEIKKMFEPFGEIEEFNILRNPDGTSKGCAFCKFVLRTDAQKAIDTLNGSTTMEGCTIPLVVKYADTERQKQYKQIRRQQQASMAHMTHQVPYYTPYAGPIYQYHPQAQAASLPPMAVPVQGLTLPGPGAPAGYANNYRQMAGGLTSPGSTGSLRGQQPTGPDGANLFIYHLPQEVTDQMLLAMFEQFGRIVSACVYLDRFTGQSKCFGFVSYDAPSSAALAIQQMNGYQIGGKRLKVQLKRSPKEF
eukprot:Colp12_sorted_trinity150504_noHs@30611